MTNAICSAMTLGVVFILCYAIATLNEMSKR